MKRKRNPKVKAWQREQAADKTANKAAQHRRDIFMPRIGSMRPLRFTTSATWGQRPSIA